MSCSFMNPCHQAILKIPESNNREQVIVASDVYHPTREDIQDAVQERERVSPLDRSFP